MMNLGKADPVTTSVQPDSRIASFFGRFNYDYKNRYLLSGVFRADGSSKFAKGNRWGYFPSAAVAWRISEEKFLAFADGYLSNLKFRFSYGQSGNNRIPAGSFDKTFSVSTGSIFMEGSEETPSNFIIPESTLSNPKLKWETTVTRNIGIDFGFFNQRLSGTVELYKNTTKDLLIRATIPSSTGYTTQYRNIGQTSNRGLEITLEGTIIDRKDFMLSASFNIGFNKNHIDDLGEVKKWTQSSGWASAGGPSNDYLIEEGGEVGLMYGYQTAGMYTFDDFTYDPANQTYTLNPGVPDNQSLVTPLWFAPGARKFVNQDDNPVITTGDKVIIGNANPKHTGGFILTSGYKGFDLSAAFNWSYGNDVYNANKLNYASFQSARYYKNTLTVMSSENRFTYINRETGMLVMEPTELAEINKNANIWSGMFTTNQLHSWAIEDGSFLRLNNLTLGYTLPKKILRKINIEKIRLFATGYNLWIWTKYSGYDPEVDSRRSTPLTPGVDWCAYPRSRTFNFGLNVTF
jgi:TonB-linked SusC/RagA family outer membrane protein